MAPCRLKCAHLCVRAYTLSVSEWGHDFRPEYRQLGKLRETLPDVPIMALTATALPTVQTDIQRSLGLRSPLCLRQSALRTNLKLACLRKLGGLAADLQPLVAEAQAAQKRGGVLSTLVYCPTIAECTKVHAYLQQQGLTVGLYHGSLTPPQREAAHLAFLSGRVPMIVATVAFGMGIDKRAHRCRRSHASARKRTQAHASAR